MTSVVVRTTANNTAGAKSKMLHNHSWLSITASVSINLTVLKFLGNPSSRKLLMVGYN
jgi:hypothetical protein